MKSSRSVFSLYAVLSVIACLTFGQVASAAANLICEPAFRSSDSIQYPSMAAGASFFGEQTITAVETVSRGAKFKMVGGVLQELVGEERELQAARDLEAAAELVRADLERDPVTRGVLFPEIRSMVQGAAQLNFRRGDDSPAEFEAALEFERYRLHLERSGIDQHARPESFKNLLKQFGFASIAHGTELSGLAEILLEGSVKPVDELTERRSGRGLTNYVYLEVLNRSKAHVLLDSKTRHDEHYERVPRSLRLGSGKAYLEFDSSVLDRLPWHHMNVHWQYGNFDKAYSLLPTQLLAAFFNLQAKSNEPYSWIKWQFRNEFLMEAAVPLRGFLKAIHVAPEQVESVKRELQQKGVSAEFVRLVQ